MLRYRILCVGRRARDPLLDAADHYVERLSHYAKIEVVRARDGSLVEERDAVAGKLTAKDHIVALDEHGQETTTEQLARRIRQWEQQATANVAFLIGGAQGLHPRLKDRAREVLSLSRLTLPHRLALVLLLEQLYRGHTILRGEPYHRA